MSQLSAGFVTSPSQRWSRCWALAQIHCEGSLCPHPTCGLARPCHLQMSLNSICSDRPGLHPEPYSISARRFRARRSCPCWLPFWFPWQRLHSLYQPLSSSSQFKFSIFWPSLSYFLAFYLRRSSPVLHQEYLIVMLSRHHPLNLVA
jgi:hypothetical protein